MGSMTAEMASLRNEIEALRDGRAAFMKELAGKVSDLRDGVHQMQTGFRTAHADMTRARKAESKAFITTLRRTVGDLSRAFAAESRAFADEMVGMRAAWIGNGSASHVQAKKAERSAKHKSKE